MGGKILSAYFGSSYVMWTVILGITMLSLAIGYYVGGVVSAKKDLADVLFYTMLIGAVLIAFMVISANSIFSFFSTTEIYKGLIFSSILLISPSLMCIGSMTSVLIQLINKNTENSGNSSGRIYGYSTLGGISGTFLTVFL
jgi:predicted membrane-bound spermidine synthase